MPLCKVTCRRAGDEGREEKITGKDRWGGGRVKKAFRMRTTVVVMEQHREGWEDGAGGREEGRW